MELPRRNRSLLLNTLLPLAKNLDVEDTRYENRNYFACMKHEQVMRTHSSRCIPHIRMGKVTVLIVRVNFSPVHQINQNAHRIKF